ncbi:hypothetical protein WR25_25446 [Diploscapter pachys]|uniref:Uncharacterized protein n=1 Tax=Diploscapter pachys TaxID=2018661 RepID=A0A2A2J2D5_9BILA|nr:hypothetical protein WR25_25446 [Diploscapter pachys]
MMEHGIRSTAQPKCIFSAVELLRKLRLHYQRLQDIHHHIVNLKSVKLLNLVVHGRSNCIKPSNATCLAAKVKPKAMKALGKPYDELSAIAMKCRKNNAGQSGMYEKCANNVYKKALAYVYKAYVDQACLKLSTAINVAEYNCCRKMVDLVVKKDVSGKYSCYSKAKPKAGTTPTCPK